MVNHLGEKSYQVYQKQTDAKAVSKARNDFLFYRKQEQWSSVLMMCGLTGIVFSF